MNRTGAPRVPPWQTLQHTLAAAIRLPRPGAVVPAEPVMQSWLVRALMTTRPAR
jgi:hypothetical protein